MEKREIRLDPELNLVSTLARAKKLAARATKKGLSGGYVVTTETRTEINPVTGEAFEQTYLILEGSPAKYNGWTFLGLAEWVNGEALVYASPTAGVQIDRSLLVEGGCDHCGVNRARKSVIVVENEAGERKQVGKQCAKDYLGQSSPVTWFAPVSDTFDEFAGYSGLGTAVYKLGYILTVASSVVRQRGFVRSSGNDGSALSTRELVELFVASEPTNKYALENWLELRAGYDADKDTAAGVAAFEFAQGLEGFTDYVLNVKAVISVGQDGYFSPKNLGLVVSLAGVYAKSVAKKALEDADPTVNEPFGQVGDKITLEVKAVSSNSFDTVYGTTYANVFTGEGYRFKWLTGTRYFDEGDTLTLKGTIKGYDEWDGKTYTLLTRCKEIVS